MKHGFSQNDKLYWIWNSMIRRCYNSSHTSWAYYGGRVDNPVTVCDEWRHNFMAFREWALANGYNEDAPEKMTLDRINILYPYEKNNCRWTTYKEQNNNTSRNLVIVHKGIRLTASQWAEIYGLNPNVIYKRYKNGVRPPELFKPTKHGDKKEINIIPIGAENEITIRLPKPLKEYKEIALKVVI